MNALKVARAQLQQNPRQWEAFQEAGHCVVLAPPGSGKTELLTAKAADLASNLTSGPRGLACVTMTNEAADEIQRRLTRLGARPSSNLFVGTVHSFAFTRIVRPFGKLTGVDVLSTNRLASLAEERTCLARAFEEVRFSEREQFLAGSTMKIARQRIDLSGNPRLGGQRIADLARAYELELRKENLFDYMSLVTSAVRIVEGNPWVARSLAASFAHIFVDEYQDLSPGLDRIVRAICLADTSESRLFAVGDPDQSIYGFSGAHPELLKDLAALPVTKTVSLELNYRSNHTVVTRALEALGEQRTISTTGAGGLVVVHPGQKDLSGQVQLTTQLASSILKSGTPAEQLAIISPWKNDCEANYAELLANSIPVYIRRDEHWSNSPTTVALEIAAAWASQDMPNRVPVEEAVRRFRGLIRAQGRVPRHRRIKSLIDIFLQAEPSWRALDFIQRCTDAYLEEGLEGHHDEVNGLLRMRQALGDEGALSEWTVAELGLRARSPGQVMCSTIHGVKGLQFDAVIISGADSASLVGFSGKTEDQAEARRKLYVSMTRARNRVDIVYCTSRQGRKGPYQVNAPDFVIALRS